LNGKPTTVALAFTKIECSTHVSRGHEETVAAYIAAKGRKRMAFRVFE
jgi:hypothetical protein